MDKEKTPIWYPSLRAVSTAGFLLIEVLSAAWYVQIHGPPLQTRAAMNSFSFVGRPMRKLIRKGNHTLCVVSRIMGPKDVHVLISET